MLERLLARANRWALDRIGPQWVDYVVSNTMTDFNRRFNGFLWSYDLQAQVEQVIDEAPGVKTFVLRPNQHWHRFKPGQHVEVSLPVEGEPLRRRYSVSGAPLGRLSITVKRIEQGRGSGWMHEHLRAGMRLRIGHPQGRFCHEGQAKVLYLCAGSGITPCHSMVAALLAQPLAERPDIQVMAQFRQAGDVVFKDALQAWQQAGVKVLTALSAASPAEHTVQRLNAQTLRQHCPDLRERDIFLCGPAGFMAGMIEDLRSLGVDMARVHSERFVALDEPAPDCNFQVEGTELCFPHLDASITLTAQDQGKTLLQAAADHGLALESGCGQGMCGTCKLHLQEGHVSGNALGQAVYLCTAYPASCRVVLSA